MHTSQPIIKLVSRNRKIVLTFLVGILVTLPLLTHKVYYQDDYYRIMGGSGSYWLSNGRPITWLLNELLRFSSVINDVSPLPLLLGLGSLAVASVIYVEKLELPLKGYWPLVPAQFMTLNPFLAQSMLFSYDSMTMLLAVALALIASLSLSFSRIKHLLLTTALLLITMMTYQTGLNIYIGCVVIMTASLWSRQQNSLGFLSDKLFACIAAVLIYKLVIVNLLPTDEYSLQHSKIVALGPDMLPILSRNIVQFFDLYMSAFPGLRVLLIVLPLTTLFVGLLRLFLTTLRRPIISARFRVASGLLLLAAPVVVIATVSGLSTILASPVFVPRVIIASSCLFLFCFYVSIKAFPSVSRFMAGLYCVPLLYFMVMMISCFNTAVNTQSYTVNVIQQIKADLSHISQDEATSLAFIGQLGQSPDVQPSLRAFPLIGIIQLPMLVESYSWGYYPLFWGQNIRMAFSNTTPEMKAFKPERYLAQSCDYRLFIYQKTAVFDLRDGCPPASDGRR